jgi:hypothetical protein
MAGSTSLLLAAGAARGQNLPDLPRTDYGGVGLIDMPTARMAPDGELSLSGFYTQNTERFVLGFQALPWLETSFRYTGLQQFNASYSVYFDRSFAFKMRLWDESSWLPAVAVGANDIVGTGVYGGEYLVASKSFGAVDASLGLGWGRMGSVGQFRNPLSLISSSFDVRPGGGEIAGATNFGAFLHGPQSALFGGVSWATPLKGLTLIAEYSSDAYLQETASGTFRPARQINLGASYQYSDNIQANIGWLYGHSIGGSIHFTIDPTTDLSPQKMGPLPLSPSVRTAEEQQGALRRLSPAQNQGTARFASAAQVADALWGNANVREVSLQGDSLVVMLSAGNLRSQCLSIARQLAAQGMLLNEVRVTAGTQQAACPVSKAAPIPAAKPLPLVFAAASVTQGPIVIDAVRAASASLPRAEAKIRADAAAQSIAILSMTFDAGEVAVYYSNDHYFDEETALDRLIRLLMADAPPETEKFRLISVVEDLPVRQFTVLRAPAERSFSQSGDLPLDAIMTAQPVPMDVPAAALRGSGYPRLSWSVFPQLRQAFFDPNQPLGVQMLAAAGASLDLMPGLTLMGQAEASLFDNFTTARASDSLLPHVRSDFVQYFLNGKNGIADLEADYHFRLSPTLFGVVRAGYLESMFAGIGGEVLYRPEGERWAMGVDLYGVRQRDFDRLFGLQNYQTVTGHLSFYYQSPWHELNFNFRIGRYLAGDYGATFELTRRFSSGVEIGAFFTKTNVSATQFGEGSFDKGIIIRIPLSWAMPLDSQDRVALDLRPVQRDGGQRLSNDASLYELTRRDFTPVLAAPRW